MIPASEALRLPSAQLSPEEVAAADALDAELDAHLRQHMQRGGATFDTKETRGPVIAEVTWRLRRAKYEVQVMAAQAASALDPRKACVVGYRLMLVPSDEAYREHACGMVPAGDLIARCQARSPNQNLQCDEAASHWPRSPHAAVQGGIQEGWR